MPEPVSASKERGSHSASPATPRRGFLPFAVPDITELEIEAVVRVLRSGWLTTGPEARAFEEEFARSVGAAHAVALSSCTAALHLGLEALGVGAGDEVLVPTLTFTATAEVVEYLGARSRFLDVSSPTLNLAPEDVRSFVRREYRPDRGGWVHRQSGGRLRVIMPVHFGGHLCDMAGFISLGQELGVAILDDAAHAFPARRDGISVGGFDAVTAFSFYATKTITTGEGGMLTTNDDRVAARVRLMALHGISRDAWNRYSAEGSWQYDVLEAGYKYNLTDVAAALGRVQLARAAELGVRRRAIADRYRRGLADLAAVELPVVEQSVEHAWHLFPLRLNLDRLRLDRAAFIQELRRRNIGASVHFIPLHRQTFYRTRYGYIAADFPVAEREFPRLLSVPIYSVMSDAEVDDVIAALRDIGQRFAA